MHRLMKMFSLLFVLILTFSLVSCNSASDLSESEKKITVTKVEQDTVKENEATEQNGALKNVNEDNTIKERVGSITNEKSDVSSNVTIKEQVKLEETSKTKESAKEKQASSASGTTNTENTTDHAGKKTLPSSSKTESTKEKSGGTTSNQATTPKKQIPAQPTVSISIIGSKDRGVILPKTVISFKEGDTVLDVLLKASEKKNLQVEYRGSGAMAYIEGIDNIYEFDYGPKSGWNYKKNGTVFNKSSDSVKVQKDDQIEWIYSEDFMEEK